MTYQRNDTPEPLAADVDDPITRDLKARAADLVDSAAATGRILTIFLRPRQPLAMRNYDVVIDVRTVFKR